MLQAVTQSDLVFVAHSVFAADFQYSLLYNKLTESRTEWNVCFFSVSVFFSSFQLALFPSV